MKPTDIARQYRQKYGMEMPTLKLARIMHKAEPLMFTNVEHARTTLRGLEGKAGKAYKVADKSMYQEGERPRNPYNLPKSEETSYEPYYLTGIKRIGLLCDIHVPYHNIEALTVAINHLKKEKPDCVVLNGDLFDFHGLSRYMKDPRKKNFSYELNTGGELINTLQKVLKCQVVFKLGNHDERYQHFLWTKAGEIADVEDFQLENLLARRCKDVTIVGDKRVIKAGGLNIIHGHEFPSGIASPVNIARGFFLRGKTSVIGGHHHRTSEHTEQDMNGKITTTWSVGCLSELHPAYMPLNSWNWGMAVIDVHGEDFNVRNHRIYNGRIL